MDVLPDEVSFLLKENQRLKADISDLRETTDQLKVSLGALSKAMESMQAQLSSSQRANEGRNAAEMDLPPKAPPPPAQPLPPAPVTDPPSQPVAPPTIPPPRENRETASLKPPPPPLPPPRPPTTIVPITVPTIAAVQPASVAEPENPGPGIGVEYTLKAKGIPVLALPEKISVFFSTSGPVRFIEPEYDVQGKATQYLIVSFASAAALSAAIKMNSRKWPNTNKYVTVREVYFGGKQPPGCKTVRVSRLPVSITKERLEILFKDCGVISHVKFYSCCVKGITTVVALVDFLEEKSAYAAVRLSGSVVSKRTVRIFYFVSKSKGNEGAATTVLSKETNVSIKGTGRSLSSGAQLPEGKGQKRIRSRVRTSEHESDVYRGTEGGHAGEDGADGDGKEEGNSKEREADVDEQDIVQFLESTCSTQSTRADALVLIIHRICKEASTRRNFLRKGGTFLLLKWLVDEIRDKSFDEVSVRTRLPYVCDLGVSVAVRKVLSYLKI